MYKSFCGQALFSPRVLICCPASLRNFPTKLMGKFPSARKTDEFFLPCSHYSYPRWNFSSMPLNLLLLESSPSHCVAPARNLTALFAHIFQPSHQQPHHVCHQNTWPLISSMATSCSGLPSPVTWNTAFTLVSLSHPHLPSLGDSYHSSQNNPAETKWEHVLPSPETLPWLPPHSKQNPQLLQCRRFNNKALMISPCCFSPIIPLLFSSSVTLCLFL